MIEIRSEVVDVKYRGSVELGEFDCRDIKRSSIIERVCYQEKQRYLVVKIIGFVRSLIKPGDDAIAANSRGGDLDGWNPDAGFASSATYGVLADVNIIRCNTCKYRKRLHANARAGLSRIAKAERLRMQMRSPSRAGRSL